MNPINASPPEVSEGTIEPNQLPPSLSHGSMRCWKNAASNRSWILRCVSSHGRTSPLIHCVNAGSCAMTARTCAWISGIRTSTSPISSSATSSITATTAAVRGTRGRDSRSTSGTQMYAKIPAATNGESTGPSSQATPAITSNAAKYTA
jgi:hypothetical protein